VSRGMTLLLTCEHGGNRVPAAYRRWFSTAAARKALASHRGWDPGALAVARGMARRLGCPLFGATTSRLVVELNRSERHPRLFSEFTRELGSEERKTILAEHYRPHRVCVEEAIRVRVDRGANVLHLAIHSFTPVLDGERRNADLGLLYDPREERELAFCAVWAARIRSEAPRIRVRRNYPYRGNADGFTTYLRRRFPRGRYLGIEVESNQAFPAGSPARIARLLVESLPSS